MQTLLTLGDVLDLWMTVIVDEASWLLLRSDPAYHWLATPALARGVCWALEPRYKVIEGETAYRTDKDGHARKVMVGQQATDANGARPLCDNNADWIDTPRMFGRAFHGSDALAWHLHPSAFAFFYSEINFVFRKIIFVFSNAVAWQLHPSAFAFFYWK